ncbi:response regulator [Teredinibacter purpureus]|uniref:response regulator n=1 Tax=Teredinibacter purpureus TaxID=2731756 RepID=UPI0005F7C81B|nr:response regulator [Teredinibacter purpureus]
MKQIDIIKTYSQKRCLVVDDVPDIRASLKRILVDFGSSNIDTAGNAEEAIDLCQKHQYDIVLSDYNLGTGKNGQQLLEELRFHGLLRNTALYIMITAESASHYVLHALEYQPDDYLGKPINRDGLRPRLDQALLKNEALLNAKKALDAKNTKAAIAACKKLLAQQNRYANDAKKMLGELFLQQREYQNALDLHSEPLDGRHPIWMTTGAARAHIGLKQLDIAESLLNQLILDNPRCVEAHDLLAKVYEYQNNPAQAQQALHNAVSISPRSTNRQREMGRISREAGDEMASVHAYRTALKQSRNSCHEQAEDYLHLAQGLTNLSRENLTDMEELASEAMETLKAVDKRFSTQPIVKMRRKLVEADLHHVQKNDAMAENAKNEALQAYTEMRFSAVQNTSAELCIECARAFMEIGEYDKGEQLLQEVARINNDPEIAIRLDKLLREPLTREGVQLAAKLNRDGIQCYQEKQYDKAIAAFNNVLHELPNHIGLNLNMVQTIISKHKSSPLNEADIELISHSFQRIGKIDTNSGYADRYTYLTKQFKKIKVGVNH